MISYKNIKYFTNFDEFCNEARIIESNWDYVVDDFVKNIFNKNGFIIINHDLSVYNVYWCSCKSPSLSIKLNELSNNPNEQKDNVMCNLCNEVFKLELRKNKLNRILDK
jgi:hypothetical protein